MFGQYRALSRKRYKMAIVTIEDEEELSAVCPSVAYVANNSSSTQRPSVPKFGRKVPHLRCDSHTSFKVKRSKVRVSRPMLTHIVHHLPNAKAYELQSWYTYGGRRLASATGAMTSKVIGQGHKVT